MASRDKERRSEWREKDTEREEEKHEQEGKEEGRGLLPRAMAGKEDEMGRAKGEEEEDKFLFPQPLNERAQCMTRRLAGWLGAK